MNAAIVDFDPSLRRAQHAFDQWRSNRTRRGPTPIALRQCAVALLEQHCAFHVCRTLRINANALKQWSNTQPQGASFESSGTAEIDNSMDFVRLPDTEVPLIDPTPQVAGSLTIELPNETVIHIGQAFTLDEVFQAASRVGGNARVS